MKRKSVIIMLCPDQEAICRGNFKKLCIEFDLPYHSLKMKKFPIILDDVSIFRVPFL